MWTPTGRFLSSNSVSHLYTTVDCYGRGICKSCRAWFDIHFPSQECPLLFLLLQHRNGPHSHSPVNYWLCPTRYLTVWFGLRCPGADPTLEQRWVEDVLSLKIKKGWCRTRCALAQNPDGLDPKSSRSLVGWGGSQHTYTHVLKCSRDGEAVQ